MAAPAERPSNSPSPCVPSTSTLPQERRWSWLQVIGLSLLLAAIVGGGAAGAMVGVGMPLKWVIVIGGGGFGATLVTGLVIGIVKNEWQLLLKVKEGEVFNPEAHKNTIRAAIEQGITLKWEGKPIALRDAPILPGLRIGPNRQKEGQLTIEGTLVSYSERCPIEVVVPGWKGDTITYPVDPFGSRDRGFLNEMSYRWVNRSLASGAPVLVTASNTPTFMPDGKEYTFSAFKSMFSNEADAGIMVINYLKKLTGLDFDTTRRYVEKQLGYSYSEQVQYPAECITRPLSEFALPDTCDKVRGHLLCYVN